MATLTVKDVNAINTITSLRKISKNEGLSLNSFYSLLVSGKYGEEVDFDVYLPTKGFNLQRPYVWTIQQQEEFIWSCLLGRSIPPIVFIQHEWKLYQVIDGKQRLMTLKRFMLNEFPIHLNGVEYFYEDLEPRVKYTIDNAPIRYISYYSYDDEPITDDEKIVIFNFYNFAGTPQEESHREKLQNALTI